MHNPVTGSGGVMLGTVLQVAADDGDGLLLEARSRLHIGAKAVPLVRFVPSSRC